jgi:predicted nucleic acid-binding Zn ribbon protein
MVRILTPVEQADVRRREFGKICIACGQPMQNYKKKYCSDKCLREKKYQPAKK